MPRGRPAKYKSALIGFTLPVGKDHENLSVRKIDNGYIVRHDGVKGGRQFEREFFSAKPPKVDTKPKKAGRVQKDEI